MTVQDRLAAALGMGALVRDAQNAARLPSLCGEQAPLAHLLIGLLGKPGFDDAGLDRHGNVVAVMRGQGGGRSLMVNGHLDHVPPGSTHDPFSAEIVDGARCGEIGPAINGRGTCDMEANVMASAHAVAALRRAERRESRILRSAYDASVASYRQTVLTEFQQVEDELSALRIVEEQGRAHATAVRSAQRSAQNALSPYRAGMQAYSNVITK